MCRQSFKHLLVILVFMLFFTGCVPKQESNSVNLTYWSMWNSSEPQAIVLKEAIDDFMKQNQNVNVEISWNGREIRKTLQPALDNGQKIDIWDEDLERVTKNWSSYALKLDDYLAKTYEGTNGQAYEEVVMKNLLQLARFYSNNSGVYALPYQPYLFAFMYNKEHFKKAGIEKTPTTWEEFLLVCKNLKEAGFTPLTTDDAYVDTLLGYHLARLKGSDWVEKLVKDKSNALWDDEAVLHALEDYQELYDKNYFSDTVGSNKWPAGQQDIASGAVSMYLNGTWLVNEIRSSTGPNFKWGTFAYPAIKGGVDNIDVASFGAQSFQINKNSENPDMAFKLLVHVTTGKWDTALAKESLGVPVSSNGEWPSQLLEAKNVFNQLKLVYPWAGGIQADTDKLPEIAANFTKLISGNIDAKTFIMEMKK